MLGEPPLTLSGAPGLKLTYRSELVGRCDENGVAEFVPTPDGAEAATLVRYYLLTEIGADGVLS